MDDLFSIAHRALLCCSFEGKRAKLAELLALTKQNKFCTESQYPVDVVADAGRPVLPLLVHPSQVPRRRLGSEAGRIGLIHAVAHIEFNAVNLALDAAYRFRGMPQDYYRDWIRVAYEESVHFELLVNRLHELGTDYGAMPAHGGMWEMAVATNYDVMVRMALVPRVLEARGLDVTPAMVDKLTTHGDHATVKIFKRILREEIDHVRIGNRWFQVECESRGLAPVKTFSDLLRKHGRIALRGPFNREARLAAGFSESELLELTELEAEFKASFEAENATV